MNREKFNFIVPAKAENLSMVRLTTSAIASKSNFSIEKIVEISLKVGKFPSFELEDSVAYINKLKTSTFVKTIKISNLNEYSTAVFEVEKRDTKVISWNKFNEFKIAM